MNTVSGVVYSFFNFLTNPLKVKHLKNQEIYLMNADFEVSRASSSLSVELISDQQDGTIIFLIISPLFREEMIISMES